MKKGFKVLIGILVFSIAVLLFSNYILTKKIELLTANTKTVKALPLTKKNETPQVTTSSSSSAQESAPSSEIQEKKGRLVIIIDDCGYNTRNIDNFLSLDIPMNFAIIPYLPYSQKVAKRVEAQGKGVMLHMPLEALNATKLNDTTEGLLRANDSKVTIQSGLKAAILNLGVPISGFNNHMGSKFTSSNQAMTALLTEAKKEQVSFVDSMTISTTQGKIVGEKIHEPVYERSIFLDNDNSVDAIIKQINKAVELAEKSSVNPVIAIGHDRKNTFEALKKSEKMLKNSKISIILLKTLKKP